MSSSKKLSKRKSVSHLSLFSKDKERDVNGLLSPQFNSPRRKASLIGFFQPAPPKNTEKRRYSIASALARPLSPRLAERYVAKPRAKAVDSEADYLPGFPPLHDSAPISQGFASRLENRVIFRVRSSAPLMGRAMRVVVSGARRVGKTAILRQVACVQDITGQPYEATSDDTYQVLLEEADRPREILIFHDTGGVPEYGPVELKRPYLQVADAFVLVYSVGDHESFNRVDLLKKFIEKQNSKEKKDVPIVVLGNMRDLPNRKVDSDFAHAWAARERVKLFEVSAKDRNSLVDFVHYLGQRHFHPSKESKFSLSKKLKSEKSNAAILMDF